MITTKQTWLILLACASNLTLAPLLTAQESNTAVPAAGMVSNAPTTLATNEAATNLVVWNGGQPQPIVMFGQDVELKAGDSAEAVVVIGGSAKVHGNVRDAVVTICGDSEVDGDVGDAVVAVMGDVHLKPGAKIRNDAVAVLGTLTVDPGAKIGGDTVSVGGKLDVAKGATVGGGKVNVGFHGPFLKVRWVGKWLRYCVFELRPLAPQVGFVWVIAGVFFLLYLFIAAVFPQPVRACVDSLTRRPATTFLMGLLTKILVPVVFVILLATGIGLIVVPFLVTALFLAAVVGKVAVLEWLGLQIGRPLGSRFQRPLSALLIGSLLLTVLYLVPILGLLTYTIFSVWGLGCAVTTLFSRTRRETPAEPTILPPAPQPLSGLAVATPAPTAVAPGIPPAFVAAGPAAAAAVSPAAPAVPPAGAQAQLAPAAPPVVPSAARVAPPPPGESLSYPRAGFWERMGAAFLDIVLVFILGGMASGFFGHHVRFPFTLIIALAYFAGMWAWKGMTVGGVVLKLRVVRQDGGPLTFPVALVRALAAAFSAVVLFLGFFWIAWDRDKQGWHDKIAGTVVVRLPRSMPLVCI